MQSIRVPVVASGILGEGLVRVKYRDGSVHEHDDPIACETGRVGEGGSHRALAIGTLTGAPGRGALRLQCGRFSRPAGLP
jgi:hypothetical protein